MSRRFDLSEYGPHIDGTSDDLPALKRCFAAAGKAGGGVVVTPPGYDFVSGEDAVALSSGLTVLADGARITLFARNGDDIVLEGNVFDGAVRSVSPHISCE